MHSFEYIFKIAKISVLMNTFDGLSSLVAVKVRQNEPLDD